MTIQQRILAQSKDGQPPKTGDFLVEDATEVVETGFPIGARIKFERQDSEPGTVSYTFAPA